MIRIAIVDDEIVFINKFKVRIEELFHLNNMNCVITYFTKSTEFLNEYEKTDFDLIFLDIDIPDISGIQIASDIRKKNSDTTLMFVSGHDNFVFESIHYAPFRFIRKADLEIDTEEAVKAYCKIVKTDESYIMLNLEEQNKTKIDLSEVIYFFSQRHDIYLFNNKNETHRLTPRTYTMDNLEKLVGSKNFIRIHKTYLLNMNFIYKIKSEKVHLKDNSEIPISRIRTASVKEQYQLFLRRNNSL